MQVFPNDKVIYWFDPANEPVYTVQDGEVFQVHTDDCYSGQIQTVKDLRPNIDISIMDAAVGPIAVAGAEPGDVLKVDILDIAFADHGVMVTSPGLGVLGASIQEPNTKIIPIRNGYAQFSESIRLPLTPMIGVLGVSPASGKIHCAVPGAHGGNMDTKEITCGASVYLPVFVEGANLAVSDLHACMGDGELSGTGIETAGTVTLRATVIKGQPLTEPVIENGHAVYMLATRDTFEEGMQAAVARAVQLLCDKNHLSFPDAYRLMSATSDIRVSQVVNGVLTVKVKVPKYALNWETFL